MTDAPKVQQKSHFWPRPKPSGLHTRPEYQPGAVSPPAPPGAAAEPEDAPEPEAPHKARRRVKGEED